MKSIWLTGGSGTGKSTLAKVVSERYEIPIKKEVTRASDNILKTDFATRQTFFTLNYVARHIDSQHSNSFISDRCILDYVFWTLYNGHENDFLMDEFMGIIRQWISPLDTYIVAPTPSWEIFREEVFPNFMDDQLRYAIYIGKHHDIYGYTPYSEDEFARFLHGMSMAMQADIQRLLVNNSTDLLINVIAPSGTGNTYWSWQDEAVRDLDKLFDASVQKGTDLSSSKNAPAVEGETD